ncbi:nucleoside hydrolase [Jannaschia seohaensis]|uniref:Purine nucleosidase/non-specific riboncleoside hydrolase n=1 Tax=Jannaschia seohaensis TaxID=475081 RepID=A0A2Y9AXJ8_9RHOB|nr:nucleoside hydrolase [Jannaschia seohaensis]PWJ16127.1 purine nucleosidase/non-specific riboncleoside hydrolase [Jannaschia seohaensis]SSA49000.1 purine nucleosidase/non-specific riboncleoside hydrolase [Jannaschia seohaensis]
MTARAPLILDTDGGVDDAQALLLLLAAGVVPEAITTVFGNVALEAATRNMLTVLAWAGVDVPVHMGQGAPLLAPRVDAREIHGEDGLGSAPRPARQGAPVGRDAVNWLVERLRRAAAQGAPVDLLAIGPLTNIALALRLAPEIGDGIGRLIVMGGTRHGRGNVTPAAEFNVYADPEAAAIVVRTVPVLLVPWEICTAHALSGAEVDAIFEGAEGDRSRFAHALADHARRTAQGFGHPDHLRFVDPLAAALAVSPEIAVETETASLDVILAEGPARGAMLTDPSGRLGTPRATVLVRADMSEMTRLYAASCR